MLYATNGGWMLQIKNKTNRNKQRETWGQTFGNFHHKQFLNDPLVRLPFVMVEHSDCDGDCRS